MHVRENSDISRSGQGGAAHGSAASWGGEGQHGTPTGRFAQKTTVSLAPRDIGNENPALRTLRKNEQTKSYVNRCKNTTRC